ncbi:MAG: hypothetical protein M3O29_05545 [Actinomycetota bacterium]|nr:hypothetical protein [Actinomycetota bacterium]
MSVDGRLRNGLSRDASAVNVDVDNFLDDVVRRGRRQRRVRRIGAVAITLAMIVAMVVVAPTVRDAIRDHTKQPAVPQPPGAIEGTYAVRIVSRDTSGPATSDLAGLWQFTLRGDGLLTAQGPPAASVSTSSTRYHVAGDQIFTTAFQSGTCSGVGVYRWSREGSTLVFTLVSDTCAVRVTLFTARPWEAR